MEKWIPQSMCVYIKKDSSVKQANNLTKGNETKVCHSKCYNRAKKVSHNALCFKCTSKYEQHRETSAVKK